MPNLAGRVNETRPFFLPALFLGFQFGKHKGVPGNHFRISISRYFIEFLVTRYLLFCDINLKHKNLSFLKRNPLLFEFLYI